MNIALDCTSAAESFFCAIGECCYILLHAIIVLPISATSNPVGSKCGVSNSTLYLGGLWSSKGETNGIDAAAKQAGITKISHVDSYAKNYFLGIIIKQTIKVYGE